MDKNKKKWTGVVLLGVLSAGLLALACWWSVQYNDARLVAPIDLSTYVFRVQDLPMLLAGALFALYVLGLFVLLLRGILARRRREAVTQTTRSLSPKLGFLGLLGLLGFAGFWSYPRFQDATPFFFFLFLGFFGFFYEGKLSNTFMDERFRENQMRAQYNAMKLGYGILFLAYIILAQGRGRLENLFLVLVIVLALVLALVLFLSEYLLYRYDHDEEQE